MKFSAGLQRLIWIVFGFAMMEGLFGVPNLAWDLMFAGRYSIVGIVIGILTATAGVVLALRYRERLTGVADGFVRTASPVPPHIWLVAVIALGIAIRIGWMLLYPADVQVSDHAIYSRLAEMLMRGEPYQIGNTYSYWPPAYPLFLAAGYWLFGVHHWVICLGNLLLYAGSIVVTWRLGKLISGESAARIATALIAIWPNLVMSSSLAKKELLLALLVPLALLLYLHALSARTRRGSLLFALFSGLSLGATCLAQPSFMLFPSVMVAYELFGKQRIAVRLVRVAVLVTGMVAVISPWTVRNYLVLHAFVPIATTGGNNFYSANNELATGGYISRYERDLNQFDELTDSRMGYQWGKQWIRENPGKFLTLMIKKQLRVMSDDSDGVYWVLKAGRAIGDGRYIGLKGISNMFWLTVVWLMFAFLVLHWPPDAGRLQGISLVMLSLLYVWSIHSVFQAGSRHHVPLVPGFAILIGCLARDRVRSTPSE